MTISKTILLGNLGQAPKIGKTNSGKDYANFSIATSKKWKNDAGEKQEKTTWHNISCFGNIATVCQYLDKGSVVYVEGELSYSTYKNKEGAEVAKTEIIANVIDIIKGKDKDKAVDKHNKDKSNAYQPEQEDMFESGLIPF